MREITYESFRKLAEEPRPIFTREEYVKYKEKYAQRSKILLLIESDTQKARFYHQIRYGCTEPNCKTPTCHSYRSRNKKGSPYRKPTQVTARAIASFLAAVDSPYEKLCLHTPAPRLYPFDIAFPASRRLYFLLDVNGEVKDSKTTALKNNPELQELAEFHAKAEFEEWLNHQALSGTAVDLKATYPYVADSPWDSKSFTQRFFSTASWKLSPVWEILGFDDKNAIKPQELTISEPHLHANNQSVQECLERYPEAKSAGSFLLDAILSNPILHATYHASSLPGAEMSIDTGSLKDRTKNETFDIGKLGSILSNPSKLMYYGLRSTPDSCKRSTHQKTSATTLDCYTTQPLAILTMEFAVLQRQYDVDLMMLHIWLAPSVKATYYSLDTDIDIPGFVAAHICAIALATLVTCLNTGDLTTYGSVRNLFEGHRKHGHIFRPPYTDPVVFDAATEAYLSKPKLVELWELAYEDPAAQYLMRLILRSLASWSYASAPLVAAPDAGDGIPLTHSDFKQRLLQCLCGEQASTSYSTRLNIVGIIEWCITIFLRDWNGEALFKWDTDVGAAIEFLDWLFTNRRELGIEKESFVIYILEDRLDFVEACKVWLSFEVTAKEGHLFEYPWLFSATARVTFFRSASMSRMFAAFEVATVANRMANKMSFHITARAQSLLERIQTSRDIFLVLEIRRDNILRDAFNQLWRRQKRELFRPLKVKMGMDEGEEGVDMGGVQQEFFRLAIAEALDPAHGLFSVDERTRMTWFQPLSTAPLYQFTLIGLLFGLAVYNGITLTITFPEIFYQKLLAVNKARLLLLAEPGLEDIKSGWPQLHSGLKSLLEWSDGGVEDVFVRNYIFSFEANGTKHDVDMQATNRDAEWPKDPNPAGLFSLTKKKPEVQTGKEATQEPSMVTNDNRQQYVQDYVFWLLHKSIAPQFDAFAAGFYLPLHKKTLRLFEPQDLKLYLEGSQEIDIAGLKKATRYEDGFGKNHEKIQEFWEIVEGFSPEQHRKLLEFVTASPRIPVRGMSEVTFIIQRNGVGDERLPTSMTCFSRLLLPEYSSKELMAEKLRLAIENSTGFGTQ